MSTYYPGPRGLVRPYIVCENYQPYVRFLTAFIVGDKHGLSNDDSVTGYLLCSVLGFCGDGWLSRSAPFSHGTLRVIDDIPRSVSTGHSVNVMKSSEAEAEPESSKSK
jgi:hypothetical protein